MNGLSPKTWKLVTRIFPGDPESAARILLEECGQNLPFCRGKDEYELERVRFAALKISEGDLARLRKAVEIAKRDWRDELMWAGFGESLSVHTEWAAEVLGLE